MQEEYKDQTAFKKEAIPFIQLNSKTNGYLLFYP